MPIIVDGKDHELKIFTPNEEFQEILRDKLSRGGCTDILADDLKYWLTGE
jgi:hypothetical protein